MHLSTEGLHCSERRKELWWVEERARLCTFIHRGERNAGGVAPLFNKVKGMEKSMHLIPGGERIEEKYAPHSRR
jgi:hypothetical protein